MSLATVRGYLLVASDTNLLVYNTTSLGVSTASPLLQVFDFPFSAPSSTALFAASYAKINSRILPSIVLPFVLGGEGGELEFVVYESLLPFQRTKPIDLSWVRGPLLLVGLLILIYVVKQRKGSSTSSRKQRESMLLQNMDRYLSNNRRQSRHAGGASSRVGQMDAGRNQQRSSEHLLDSILEDEEEEESEAREDLMPFDGRRGRYSAGTSGGVPLSRRRSTEPEARMTGPAAEVGTEGGGGGHMLNEYDLLRQSIQRRQQKNIPQKGERATSFLQSIQYGSDLLDDELDPWR